MDEEYIPEGPSLSNKISIVSGGNERRYGLIIILVVILLMLLISLFRTINITKVDDKQCHLDVM